MLWYLQYVWVGVSVRKLAWIGVLLPASFRMSLMCCSMITARQAHPHVMLKSKISQKLPNKLSSERLSSKLPCGAAKSSLLSHLVTDQVPEQGRTPAVWVAFFPHQLTWWQVAGLWLIPNSFFSTCQIFAFTSSPIGSFLGALYLFSFLKEGEF